MIGNDKYKYRKCIEEMKNYILRKKDPCPNTAAEACHTLSKWKNQYEGEYNSKRSGSNDGITFATVTEEKEQNKSNKKKEITCLRWKKVGQYSNKCKEDFPKTKEERRALVSLSTRIIALLKKQYKKNSMIQMVTRKKTGALLKVKTWKRRKF